MPRPPATVSGSALEWASIGVDDRCRSGGRAAEGRVFDGGNDGGCWDWRGSDARGRAASRLGDGIARRPVPGGAVVVKVREKGRAAAAEEAGPAARKAAIRDARHELLVHLEALTEPVMLLLGLGFVGLLALRYSGLDLDATERTLLNRGLAIIYAAFVADFVLRLQVTPTKGAFLRRNWLLVVSLVFPAVRPLHAAGAVWGLPPLQLLGVLNGLNRGLRALRHVTRGRQFAYLASLSVLAVLVAAGSVLYFDRATRGADIRSFGEALWWAATLVTTINSSDDPVSVEGRLVAILLRIYALSVFGYLTASIAAYFIGTAAPTPAGSSAPAAGGAAPPPLDLAAEMADLRGDVARLRRDLAERRHGGEPRAEPDDAAGGSGR